MATVKVVTPFIGLYGAVPPQFAEVSALAFRVALLPGRPLKVIPLALLSGMLGQLTLGKAAFALAVMGVR